MTHFQCITKGSDPSSPSVGQSPLRERAERRRRSGEGRHGTNLSRACPHPAAPFLMLRAVALALRGEASLSRRERVRSRNMFEFAFTLKPDMTPDHIVALTKQAEAAGFAYGWIFDSHVLWQEPYPLLTLMAANTKRM